MQGNPQDGPATGVPVEVAALLSADDESGEAAAWSAFLDAYSRLILFVARKSCSGGDAAMDRYAYVLENLRQDDYARLRAYEVDDRARFSTWLAVVVQRLCTDFQRRRYGRHGEGADTARETRRRLVDLVGAAVDIELLADHRGDPDHRLQLQELQGALAYSVGQLEPRDRLLLSFRFHDGHSARTIAETMGYPSQFHVYRRLKKVLATLRSDLEARGIEGADL